MVSISGSKAFFDAFFAFCDRAKASRDRDSDQSVQVRFLAKNSQRNEQGRLIMASVKKVSANGSASAIPAQAKDLEFVSVPAVEKKPEKSDLEDPKLTRYTTEMAIKKPAKMMIVLQGRKCLAEDGFSYYVGDIFALSPKGNAVYIGYLDSDNMRIEKMSEIKSEIKRQVMARWSYSELKVKFDSQQQQAEKKQIDAYAELFGAE